MYRANNILDANSSLHKPSSNKNIFDHTYQNSYYLDMVDKGGNNASLELF